MFYFYLWDVDFGPAFIKICAYFPYPIKVWVNGHECAKRQATAAGIEWTALSNGFATCQDPAALQGICDRLGPGTIEVFFQRWMAVLPLPLTEHDRVEGFWWELSMRQIEVSADHGVLAHPGEPGRSSRHWSPTTWTSAAPTASSSSSPGTRAVADAYRRSRLAAGVRDRHALRPPRQRRGGPRRRDSGR